MYVSRQIYFYRLLHMMVLVWLWSDYWPLYYACL